MISAAMSRSRMAIHERAHPAPHQVLGDEREDRHQRQRDQVARPAAVASGPVTMTPEHRAAAAR